MGRALTAAEHDVLALDQDQTLRRLPDPDVLELAERERRIVVTHNVKDFVPLCRSWTESGRSHAGCVLITLRHDAYGPILRGLLKRLGELPHQEDWTDRVEFLAAERTGQ